MLAVRPFAPYKPRTAGLMATDVAASGQPGLAESPIEFDFRMARPTRTEIVEAFRRLLGRPPENEQVIAAYQQHRSLSTVLTHMVASGEFIERWQFSPFYHINTVLDVGAILKRHEFSRRAAKPGHVVNFLGVATDTAFAPALAGRGGQVEGLPIPSNWHADMAEFAAVLRAVDLTRDRFSMIELGCGWGCWMNNAGVAARRRNLRIRLIGVEGDKSHIGFARQALETNGISPVSYTLHHGIAGARAGVALFPRENADGKHWGLEPLFDPSPAERESALSSGDYHELPIIGLRTILGNERRISLLHVDIQGGETALVRDNIELLTQRVAYMVIGTHSRMIEGQLMETLLAAGWKLEIERPAIFDISDEGPVTRVDGIQGWRNLKLTGLLSRPLF